MANKDTAKTWFETGDFPTEAQFWQVFDWLRWKDEKIGTADLDDTLLAIINSLSRVIVLPAGVMQVNVRRGTVLEYYLIKEETGTALTVSVGITPFGTEIFNSVPVDTSNPQNGLLTHKYYCWEDKTIYFTISGAPADQISINIYKS